MKKELKEKETHRAEDDEPDKPAKGSNEATIEDIDSNPNDIDPKEKQILELTDTLKRLQAEFENYKKRSDRDKLEFSKYASASVIEKLLPVVDSFEMAIKHSDTKEKFVQGIKMIYAQLISQLESAGLRPIKTEGEMFDPYRHEVLMKGESDKPEGTIIEEFQRGYLLHDRVLRFSKVKISGK